MRILTPNTVPGNSVRIFLDDRDISNLCFYAEAPDGPGINGQGRVKIYIGKKVGKVFTIDVDAESNPAFEEKIGMVRWEPTSWVPVP
jgi:hypothetical protein